ncbi:MAG: DUF4040 domain-containing protein [Ignisphaera sp.]
MIILFTLILIASLLSTVMAYLAVIEKRILYSVIYLSFLSVCYSLIYFALMAPDVVLTYIPIATILQPFIILSVIAKTSRKRFSNHGHDKH